MTERTKLRMRTRPVAWDALDEKSRALLRPLIDRKVLVALRDAAENKVMVRPGVEEVMALLPSLAAFGEQHTEFLRWRQKLNDRAQLWEAADRSSELLLNEQEARDAESRREGRKGELTETEASLIEESLRRHFRPKVPEAPSGEFTRFFQKGGSSAEAATPQGFTPPAPMALPSPAPAPHPAQPAGPWEYTMAVPSRAPAPAAAPPVRAPRSFWRRPLVWAGAVVLLIAGLAGSYWHFKPGGTQTTEPPPRESGQAAAERGTRLLQERQYEKAIESFSRAIDVGYPAYAERAYACRLSGDYARAASDYRTAILKKPGDAQLHADLGFTLRLDTSREDNLKLALESLSKAIQLDPGQVRYYLDRANGYLQARDAKLALNDFNSALSLDPVSALAQRGRVQVMQLLKLPVGPEDREPQVYVHVSSEIQVADARKLQDRLEQLGYLVRAISIMGKSSPAANELRYVRKKDTPQAERLLRELQQMDFKAALLNLEDKYPEAVKTHQKVFELWFGQVPN